MPIAMLIAPIRPLPLVSFGALITFVGLAFGSPAAGQLLLDQESPFELGFTQFSERRAAQTFTVGLPGILESVEVYVSQVDPTGNLLLSLHAL